MSDMQRRESDGRFGEKVGGAPEAQKRRSFRAWLSEKF